MSIAAASQHAGFVITESATIALSAIRDTLFSAPSGACMAMLPGRIAVSTAARKPNATSRSSALASADSESAFAIAGETAVSRHANAAQIKSAYVMRISP